jgi:hypothetical protein
VVVVVAAAVAVVVGTVGVMGGASDVGGGEGIVVVDEAPGAVGVVSTVAPGEQAVTRRAMTATALRTSGMIRRRDGPDASRPAGGKRRPVVNAG